MKALRESIHGEFRKHVVDVLKTLLLADLMIDTPWLVSRWTLGLESLRSWGQQDQQIKILVSSRNDPIDVLYQPLVFVSEFGWVPLLNNR